MNLGMLKLYKTIIVAILIVIVAGCSYKYEKEEFTTLPSYEEKIKDKKRIEEPKIIIKKAEPIKKIVIEEPKIIIKKAEPIKKIVIEEPKVIIKKAEPIKKIVIEEPKVIIKKAEPIKKIVIEEPKIIIKKRIIDSKYKQSTTLHKNNLKDFDFDLIKKGKADNNTFLVVGGIQGDEPGGFMAASLLSTHYKITKGSVWIVPNLNFYSILKRSRGPFGDMNRKFDKLSKSDPEYQIVQRIKKYVVDPQVKLVLNLHDGSGYYRPVFVDRNHQPNKWGQSSVIDQDILPGVEHYGDTYVISEEIVTHLNKHLLKAEDIYRTKNTHTRFGKTHEEQEMSKTLTYFAVKNGKAAFGHETTKSISVTQRVYYKLLAIEKYMELMGIKFERKFPMTIKGIKHAMDDDVSITFEDTNITLPLKDLRNLQKYFPIQKDGVINYLTNNPLVKIIKRNNIYTVFYGNRRMTRLEADYSRHLNFDAKIKFKIDGKAKEIQFGETITVKKEFLILGKNNFRTNVIGYKHRSRIETNKHIYRKNFIKRYSLGRDGKMFRIEFYKKKNFAGMILVKYI